MGAFTPKVAALLNPKKAVAVQIAGLSAWKANEKGLATRLNKENKKHGSVDFAGAPTVKSKVVSIIDQSFTDAIKDLANKKIQT